MQDSKEPIDDDDDDDIYPVSAVLSEILFALLPFAVLFLVFLHQGRPPRAYLFAPEWAFLSAVLFGQTIVRFVQGVTVDGEGNRVERIGLFVSAMIVLGLVPSMTVLALVLVAQEPQAWLGYTQIGLALLAVACFFLFGAASHIMAERGKRKVHGKNRRTDA